MVSLKVNLGDAFLIDTPPNGEHLYVAIAEVPDDKHLFVNVTTRRAKSELSCVVNPGPDIPDFVKHESVVAYKFARELDVSDLQKLITPGSSIPRCQFPEPVLKRMQVGGVVSKRLKNRYKKDLNDFLQN